MSESEALYLGVMQGTLRLTQPAANFLYEESKVNISEAHNLKSGQAFIWNEREKERERARERERVSSGNFSVPESLSSISNIKIFVQPCPQLLYLAACLWLILGAVRE